MPTLNAIADQWARRTPREQLLALGVACLAAALAFLLIARGAWATLDRLDREIDRLSTDLVNYHYQVARRESVEYRFKSVANQHSSAWSESEIRDRLRQEIYRLASRIPSALDANGIPLSTANVGGALVSIPKLGQGRLREGDGGYREYQISVHIPVAPLSDMLAYLERLQSSPQSLRLDRVDLRRNPLDGNVTADLDITRIVVDTDTVSPTTTASSPTTWDCEGCRKTVAADGAVSIQPTQAGASAWVEHEVAPGSTHEIYMELDAAGPIAISGIAAGSPLYLSANTPSDGLKGKKAVRLRFTAPEGDSASVAVHVPRLIMETVASTVKVSNLSIAPVVRP